MYVHLELEEIWLIEHTFCEQFMIYMKEECMCYATSISKDGTIKCEYCYRENIAFCRRSTI